MNHVLIEVPLVEGTNVVGFIPAPTLARELDIGTQADPHCLVMKLLLPRYGDKRYAWNTHSLPEIREAEQFYLNCLKEGLTPYCVGPGGKTSEPMPEFEPGAGEAVFKKIIKEKKTVTMLPQKQIAGG